MTAPQDVEDDLPDILAVEDTEPVELVEASDEELELVHDQKCGELDGDDDEVVVEPDDADHEAV